MDRGAEKKKTMRILPIEALYENVYAPGPIWPRKLLK